MTDELILALDNGTQSVRALLFDPQGTLVAKSRVLIEPYVSPKPNWAEQDPDYFWQSLCQACQQLWTQIDVPKSAIKGVTLTTQRASVVNVDREGKPLRPAILWLDQRRAEKLPPVGGLWGMAFRVAQLSDTIAYFQAEAEANWIHRHQRDIWDHTYKYLLLSGYLTYKLTGRMVDSVASQVGYIPFDYKRQQWAKRWDWKWQAVAVPREHLPELVPAAEQLGTISAKAAAATGIPAGLPLIAAAADKACEVLGSGCLEPHIAGLSYGTTATINTTHRKYIEVIPLIPPYPSAVAGAYSLEVQVFRGYWMVNWFKNEFGHPETQVAEERGVEPEMLFDDLLQQVPPGSHGLVLQPYWSPGVRAPGPEARGAIIGFSDVHTRAHFYRAILEGVAYALREGKERTEHRSKVPITELRVSGGGSQSDGAMQLTADLFGLPATRSHTYETSGLGAAIDAAVGLGLHPDFNSAVRAMTHIGDVFEPDHATHALYDDLFHNVYKKMYGRLRPLYTALRTITG
ncbi:MAG: FGGY-family carbohydrate kinase [Anaerolineae bacterium]|nr:FGGY-family carbohydrate kinase [Anaerolineae bacterium]